MAVSSSQSIVRDMLVKSKSTLKQLPKTIRSIKTTFGSRSSSRMGKLASAGIGFQLGGSNEDDDAPSKSHTTSGVARASAAFRQPLSFRPFSTCKAVSMGLIFAPTFFSVIIFAQAIANFSVQSTSYNCSGNIICLGDAFVYINTSDVQFSGIESGRLSLISSYLWQAGAAYYYEPVRLLDGPSGQLASFSTRFTIDMRLGVGTSAQATIGDGMTFLLSADKSHIGGTGGVNSHPITALSGKGETLGIFDDSYSTTFKSIVVEFDTFKNDHPPVYDINGNHVSFDFHNITAVAEANVTEHGLNLSDEVTKYVWVDYSNETRQLEVRISINISRPFDPLLNYTVNPFDVVEELMWVGFSGSSGGSVSNFYIGDWTFESYGVPAAPSPATTGKGSVKPPIIVAIAMGSLGLLFISLLACMCIIAFFMRQRLSGRSQLWRAAPKEDDKFIQMAAMPERFNYKQLSLATRDFSEESKLGQGAFGSVYRGVLPSSGVQVAVKKIKSDSNQGEREFMAEASIIGLLRHRNLIQLRGWCSVPTQGKYLLVYELMPNGSLDKLLFQEKESQMASLSWAQRLNIVRGTAAALDYLHQGWKQQVLHRDVKSSNIMLDKDCNAKLGDFGLARLVDHQREASTTQPAGTLGYIAPEVFPRGKFTDKTDVFAFGAVVLEVGCGRKALAFHAPEEERVLVDWVWQRLSENELMSTVDKRLKEYDASRMEVMLKVGLLCSHPDPSARPSMRGVVQILAGDAPIPSCPTSKPYPIFSADPPIPYASVDTRKSTTIIDERALIASPFSM